MLFPQSRDFLLLWLCTLPSPNTECVSRSLRGSWLSRGSVRAKKWLWIVFVQGFKNGSPQTTAGSPGLASKHWIQSGLWRKLWSSFDPFADFNISLGVLKFVSEVNLETHKSLKHSLSPCLPKFCYWIFSFFSPEPAPISASLVRPQIPFTFSSLFLWDRTFLLILYLPAATCSHESQ